MSTILAYLLSFTNGIANVADWAINHEFAAFFIGTLIVNIVYKFMPAGGIGNDIYDVLSKSFKEAMERRRGTILKSIAICFLCAGLVSCASVGTWSDTAKTKLDTFGTWADEWVGGAIKLAPTIIAAVEVAMGETTETKAATQALAAASSALGAYHAVVAVGDDPTKLQENLSTAIVEVSATVGAVQEVQKTLGGTYLMPNPSRSLEMQAQARDIVAMCAVSARSGVIAVMSLRGSGGR